MFETIHRVTEVETKKLGRVIVMENKRIKQITQAGLIGACYVAITMVFAPIGFGEIQFRISEALTILPFFTSAAIPGLFLGCILGNILGGAVLPDVIFGSLATLIGAVGTYYIGQSVKKNLREGEKPKIPEIAIATLPPIIANGLIIPFVLKYAYGSPMPIPLMMITVGIGEVISCGILGTLLGKVFSEHASEIFNQ